VVVDSHLGLSMYMCSWGVTLYWIISGLCVGRRISWDYPCWLWSNWTMRMFRGGSRQKYKKSKPSHEESNRLRPV